MTAPTAPRIALPPEAYRVMARVLRSGLLLAAALLVASLVDFVLRHPGVSLADVLAANPIEGYLTPASLATGLLGGHAQAFLTLGILVLVATPILRVGTGWYYFYRVHDVPLARVAAVVTALLLVGILVVGPLLR